MSKAPYTMFDQTYLVRVVTWTNDKEDSPPRKRWDDSLWIERAEDEYALMSDWAKGKTIRLVYRQDWLNAREDAK